VYYINISNIYNIMSIYYNTRICKYMNIVNNLYVYELMMARNPVIP